MVGSQEMVDYGKGGGRIKPWSTGEDLARDIDALYRVLLSND